LIRYNEIRSKVKESSNKLNFLHLKSLTIEEKELSEQLEEHNDAHQGANNTINKLENELRSDKKVLNSFSESLTALEVACQKHKEEFSVQAKARAMLKVPALDSVTVSICRN